MTDRETPAPYIQEKGADGYYHLVPNPDYLVFEGPNGEMMRAPYLAARTPRETPAGAVEALAAAIEVELTYDRFEHADNNELADVLLEALTASGYSLTRSVDVERWQRIETAARGLLTDHGVWVKQGYPEWLGQSFAALRTALEAVK